MKLVDNMESMIEHTITFKVAAILVVKGLAWIAVALGITPIMNFVILQIETATMLSPFAHILLNDLKIIFAALVPVLVAIKIFYEIKKVRKK